MTNMMLTFVSTVGSGPKSVALIPIAAFVCIVLFILRRKNREGKTMKFGVEIECLIPTTPQDPNHLNTFNAGFVPAMKKKKVRITSAGYSENNSSWQVRLDGSIHPHSSEYAGVEIVSRILDASKPSNWKEIEHVCEYLQSIGAYANYSCGLHIHIGLGKELKSKEALKLVQRLFLRYARAEKIFDAFVPENRRVNKLEYAHSCNDPRMLRRVLGEKEDALNLSYDIDSKYWKVNLNSIEKFGTVEFRHYAGTVDASTIQAWARFLLEFVEQTKKIVEMPDSIVEEATDRKLVAADYGMTKGMFNLWQYLCHAYEDAVKNRVDLPLQADKPLALSLFDHYGKRTDMFAVAVPVELVSQNTGLSVKYISGTTLVNKFEKLANEDTSLFEIERANSEAFYYSGGRWRPIPIILHQTFKNDADKRLLKFSTNPATWFKPIIKLDKFKKYSLWDGISPGIKSKLVERASMLNAGDAVLISEVLCCTC